ncbi:hypothetical protein BYT27DRAFT_7208450 [Phlegmacium glaucopus]|nr:hypothetical protein BYT27DRAFT_7208450 [Phlegmacium glaucopus]
MIIHIKNTYEDGKTRDIARGMVNERTFMNWPFLQEGLVVAVSDLMFKYEKFMVTPGSPAKVISTPHGSNHWKSKTDDTFYDFATLASVQGAALNISRQRQLHANTVAQLEEDPGGRLTTADLEITARCIALLNRADLDMLEYTQYNIDHCDPSKKLINDTRKVLGKPLMYKDVTFPTAPHTEVTEKHKIKYSEVVRKNVRKLEACVEEMTSSEISNDQKNLIKALYEGVVRSLHNSPDSTSLSDLSHLRGLVDLEKVVVITSYGEVGPWGSSRTRWEMEARPSHWYPSHCYDSNKKVFNQEVKLIHDLEPIEVSDSEAQKFKVGAAPDTRPYIQSQACPDHLAHRDSNRENIPPFMTSPINAGVTPRSLSDEMGVPTVRLHGDAKARAAEKGISKVLVSLSHSETVAIAIAQTDIIYTEPELFRGYNPNKVFNQEVELIHDQPIEVSDSEAQKFKLQYGDKCDIWAGESGQWFAKFKKGACVFVPKTFKFSRTVAGQILTGHYRIPDNIIAQTNHSTLWVLVSSAIEAPKLNLPLHKNDYLFSFLFARNVKVSNIHFPVELDDLPSRVHVQGLPQR